MAAALDTKVAEPTLFLSALDGDQGERRAEPVTAGVPFPRSWVHDPNTLTLLSNTDHPVPLQARVLDRWSDGSIRWALVDFQADVSAREIRAFRLDRVGQPPFPSAVLELREEPHQVSVDTGVARFVVGREVGIRCEDVRGFVVGGLEIRDGSGSPAPITVARVRCDEQGPLRSVVLVEGFAGDGPHGLVRITARYHFYAGKAVVRAVVTLHNPRRATHRGGYWDLGDTGSVYLNDVSFTLRPSGEDDWEPICSHESGQPMRPYRGPFELYQDSSGGRNWQSSNHLNRERKVPLAFQGYRVQSENEKTYGLRATPVAGLRSADREVEVAHVHFWQRFPKAVEMSGRSLVLRLLPGQWGDVHEVQGGEQITEEFVMSFERDGTTDIPLEWVRAPLRPRMRPSWYCACEVVRHLVPSDEDRNDAYLALVSAAIDGEDTFETKRERIDEFGWRNFGDIYGDHEAVRHQGPSPLISHYNNQYDAIAGFACQFFRTGDLRWLQFMEQLARHVVDIDIYHVSDDKSAYNQGLFWHTFHYTDAGLATHRTYPRASGAGGGGPSPEHNYNAGLMLHYFLTGDPRSKDAAVALGDWVINMDDGGLSPLRWLSRKPTGLASASGSIHYHGPGRASGNSVVALLTAFRLTGSGRYLVKAEQMVTRSIHPADDIGRLKLLDAERRWYYTIFLQALGAYMDAKVELGELDGTYAYARASLLHYARWMAANEYPYLDKPAILEYPTETWAAQDMRKSEVFKLAAKHTQGAERDVFLERSKFFFDYSVETLTGMRTRTLARPVVILLSNGYAHAFFQKNPDCAAPEPSRPLPRLGAPRVFVPQRAAAIKRLVILGAAGFLLALTSLLSR